MRSELEADGRGEEANQYSGLINTPPFGEWLFSEILKILVTLRTINAQVFTI